MDLPNAPQGVPDDFGQHLDLLFDMIALSWQSNMTRVSSMMLAKEVSMRTYPNLQITEAFHPLSHHQNDPDKIERLVRIQNWHTQVFAKFIKKLSVMPDGDGTMLLPLGDVIALGDPVRPPLSMLDPGVFGTLGVGAGSAMASGWG